MVCIRAFTKLRGAEVALEGKSPAAQEATHASRLVTPRLDHHEEKQTKQRERERDSGSDWSVQRANGKLRGLVDLDDPTRRRGSPRKL